MNWTIRQETEADFPQISQVLQLIFHNLPNRPPGTASSEHLIVEGLRKAGKLTLSLVAEEKDRILGMVAFSPVLVRGEERGWFALGPVGVLPDFQNKGIGKTLIKEGISLMRQKGVDGIVVLGEPGYYNLFGFRSHPELFLEGVPKDYFTVLPFVEKIPSGRVAYLPALYF